MTDTNLAIVPASTPTVKAAKKVAVKTAKPVAKKVAAKTVKPAAKKVAVKTVTVVKSAIFTLTPKAKTAEFGNGQRAAIAKLLGKKNGATRAQLIAALPDVPPANISWHLTMLKNDKLVKKTAQ